MSNLTGLSTNFFPTPNEGFTSTISGPVDSSSDTEIPLNSVSGLTNGSIYTGLIDPGNAKERAFTGVVDTGGSQITNVVFTTGTNATHTTGATVVDYVTGTHIAQISKGLLIEHDLDGTHGAITTTSINNAGATILTGALTVKSWDGWITDTNTWTYASSTTFTIPADYTTKLPKGTKIKLTQTTDKYFYVVSTSYSAPNTTVTVTGGSDYTVANAAITSPMYSYEATPQGHPIWFAYAPAATGFSPAPSETGRFSMSGKTVNMYVVISGTSNGTGFTFTLPVAPKNDHDLKVARIRDNSTLLDTGWLSLTAASTTCTVAKTVTSTTFTASGTKSVTGSTIAYEVN